VRLRSPSIFLSQLKCLIIPWLLLWYGVERYEYNHLELPHKQLLRQSLAMAEAVDPAAQRSRPSTQIKREGSVRANEEASSPRIAHTLTACCRCRTVRPILRIQDDGKIDFWQRKTRCDPGLPRCGPCERTNSHCEYYDPTKGTKIPRNYVVHLQHKVRDLEKQLADLERDDIEPDPEDVMRGAAAVRIQESDESKFLGPSSGIAITRLVMQLAKQFTDSKSISDIVPDSRARLIKERFAQEEAKPTSKIYPLISDVAAEELPNRDLTNLLVQLFNLKGSYSLLRFASGRC